MKQAVVAGRTAGLRPAERRRLDQICHRRHPVDAVADLLTLQRLAAEAEQLEEPLTLVVDGRGLCRLLWIGDLEASGRLLEKLPGSSRRQGSDLRLITCAGSSRQPPLRPGAREAVVGLGAPKWKMVTLVCYRAALSGIVTGVLLAFARIAGETAPLLLTSFGNNVVSWNMFGAMASLPISIYQQANSGFPDLIQIAWTGALLVTLGVLTINVVARILVARRK